MDIEYSASCDYDLLIIYDNTTELGTQMCGTSLGEKVSKVLKQSIHLKYCIKVLNITKHIISTKSIHFES